MHEPASTALTLAVLGLLMAISVILSRWAGRIRVPIALLFLLIGMLAGSEGLGHVRFADYGLAFRIGTISLVLILFDGGLNTSYGAIQRAIAPAAVLATAGVLGTSALVGVAAHFMGHDWVTALLLGAVVSSTDAAAVFSVLRANGIALSKRVATTLELESGLNDPLAVILTLALTRLQAGQHVSPAKLALEALLELLLGLGCGSAVGWLGRALLRRARPSAVGLLPVFSVALGFTAFGFTTLVGGSGFLATYAAAVIIGNGPIPYRTGLLRIHDALAWFGQVVMFLVLGLLVYPSHLLAVAPLGIALGLALALLARPLPTALCLWPFRFHGREIAFVGCVGLRGAVPIILAMFPVLAGVPHADYIFDVVFFIVVVNAIVPGTGVKWAARLCRVEAATPPMPAAVLEISSTQALGADVMSFYLDHASAVTGATIADVPFPSGAAVMLIVRGNELMAARGETVLTDGDHVFIFCRAEDRREVTLLFGRPED